MATSTLRALIELAEDQMGYFTTAQARSAGVSAMALVMMARRDTLERVSRGVYRLSDYPRFPHGHHMEAVLWPTGQMGVLSHETALALYGLSDVSPAKMHITLPANSRVQRSIPKYLKIHFANLPEADVARMDHMPITTPARTIRDCMSTHLGTALITQAIDDARQTNRISERLAIELRRELNAANNAAV